MNITKEIEDKLYSITKILVIDHVLHLGYSEYAVIHRPKATDGRAWTYTIVDLETEKTNVSFSQFEDYTDMLINLGIHAKVGNEDERVMEAVNLIIIGARSRS